MTENVKTATTTFSGCSSGLLTSLVVWSSVGVTVAGGQGSGLSEPAGIVLHDTGAIYT